MKTFKHLLSIILASAFIISFTTAKAQNSIDRLIGADLKSGLAAHSFVFRAQTLYPETGAVQQLNNSNYTLTVNAGAVIADIPYFVRASAASLDPSQGGLQFKSTNFKYTEGKMKRGRTILLEPKDVGGDNLQLLLTVYNDGTASLNISSTNRQSIALDGFIEAKM